MHLVCTECGAIDGRVPLSALAGWVEWHKLELVRRLGFEQGQPDAMGDGADGVGVEGDGGGGGGVGGEGGGGGGGGVGVEGGGG